MAPPRPGHPPTRTFKPRRRRLAATRAAAYDALAPRWCLPERGPVLVADDAPHVLEIGFGAGESVVAYAAGNPAQRVIGVEVHTPGVAAVLAAIAAQGITNLRVVEGDALEFLARVPEASLAGIHVLFPDPWPKGRQRRRRLLRPDVVGRLATCLAPGGRLHVATDDASYATQVVRVCDGEARLRGGVVDRPAWRVATRYEQRARAVGRPVVELGYERA